MHTTAVLTVSDSVFHKTREDLSGPVVRHTLAQAGFEIIETATVPDEVLQIKSALLRLCESARFVVTTGGTGISPRDVTPEATMAIADKILDGVAELMRTAGLKKTRFAPLSRAVCVTRGQCLILNLPGSPSGAAESLAAVIQTIPHALDLLAGKTQHHGSIEPSNV